MNNEYDYAKDLAIYLWEKHYKEDAPEWEPSPDLMGVLTQIDNMICRLVRPFSDLIGRRLRRLLVLPKA
jgi:hypothetical protein